jgi:hypothetical protein
MQFFGLARKLASFLLLGVVSRSDHPKPLFGFTGFFFANADFVAKSLLGNGVVGLAVIRTDAR